MIVAVVVVLLTVGVSIAVVLSVYLEARRRRLQMMRLTDRLYEMHRELDQEIRKKQRALSPDPPSSTYGHQFDPVSEVKRGLPSAPPGHMWELTVQRNSEFCDELTVGLLHLGSDKIVASQSVNLTKCGMWEWQRLYASNARQATARARAAIVTQLIDWAHTEAARRTPPDDNVVHHEVLP